MRNAQGVRFIVPAILSGLLAFSALLGPATPASASEPVVTQDKIQQIEELVQEKMAAGNIPGLSVTIVQGNETAYQKGFGYADLDTKKQVTDETLFELGSNSKAFTALGLLQLEKQGRVRLDDDVKKYLPWFEMKYQGKPVSVTLEQLLHHTSGIPFRSIGTIPATDSEDALEQTVRAAMALELTHQPGSQFEYATVNYDILGLVIQTVAGEPFEAYLKQNVLQPLGLADTYAGYQNLPVEKLATGYKLGFLHPQAYQPPMYRGNLPAGYVVSDAKDVAKWMKIQLHALNSSLDPVLIDAAHQPNRSVPPDENGLSYAAGWFVKQSGEGEIAHAGNNPTYSCDFAFRPGEQVGVAVMANVDSEYTENIGQGILNVLMDKEVPKHQSDTYKKADQASVVLGAVLLLVLLSLLYLIGRVAWQIGKRERTRARLGSKHVQRAGAVLLGLIVYGVAVYELPKLLFMELPWRFVAVWAPQTILLAIGVLTVTMLLFAVHALLVTLFPKQREQTYLPMIAFSFVSGIGNAFVIFIINETFVRTGNLTNGLLLYFGIGLLMYVAGQKYVRNKVVNLTNQMVYEKRVELIGKLLNTSFARLETVEKGRIEATLNNDTNVISRSIEIAVLCITNVITLLCCFLYLGVMNVYGFLFSLLIIAVLAALYFVVGEKANKLWEQTRDIENRLFRLISDMTRGFKELALHRGKRAEFQQVVEQSCEDFRDKRTIGERQFANVFVLGELLFILVIGCVAFLFPEMFKQMDKEMLRNYVFVFLYMTAPVNGVLNGFPQALQVRISWGRINGLIDQFAQLEETAAAEEETRKPDRVVLKLDEVAFEYGGRDGHCFSVGPVNYEFHSGRIYFVTGGNGSGKSTLAKLLTGLYTPTSGAVTINGEPVSSAELGQYYSAIFSDFHLFDRLYGIDFAKAEQEIRRYLELLELQDKVSVENGVFSTTNLSTGQKKRLALLVTYLEDREILLFDEWAADQDPAYRKFFYQQLLPDMRAAGKCIIAVTHDDHYFDLADHVIKMEMGLMVEKEEASS